MKGSQKQIEWALKIKQNLIETAQRRVDEMLIRDDMPEYFYMIVKELHTKFLKAIGMIETASQMIDSRNGDAINIMEEAIYKRYEIERAQKS